MDRFLAEVARVLRPGGWFGWADLRAPAMLPALDAGFAAAGLAIEWEARINEGVLAALAAEEARKRAMIARHPLMARLLGEFAGMEGSVVRRGLARGSVVYLARRCRRLPG
jgi:hypothetical protein